jgi:hypothetical protein
MNDPARHDQTVLEEARRRGGLAVLGAFIRLSGPGWLGSAFTLGAGSLAGSLFLGVIGGYRLLWVQPLAMLLGVIMLGAISYVTLSIESSPFAAIRRRLNPVMAWAWLLGALGCNMVWSLPQYSLAYGAITHNLAPGVVGNAGSVFPRLAVSLAILVIVALLTFGYGGTRRGVRIFELVLKVLVAVIVLSFLGVVVRLALSGRLAWGAIAAGLVPDWRALVEPAGRFPAVLAAIENPEARAYWFSCVLAMQRECMIGAASSTVAVNMCFLVPFSLLAKRWNRSFRGLALFDLGTGTLLPFVLVTGCVVIAAAAQFHTRPCEGIEVRETGEIAVSQRIRDPVLASILGEKIVRLEQALDARRQAAGLRAAPVTPAEKRVASMLLRRDNYELAHSLSGLFGASTVAQRIFGIGVLAMALSTISILMLISGFAVCEAAGVAHRGRAFRLGVLFPAVGVLWPFVSGSQSGAYLAVTMAVIGFTLLPVAYLTFFAIMNSRRLLGGDLPQGRRRVLWNAAMIPALVISGGAAAWTAWHKELAGFPVGRWALITLAVLLALGHASRLYRR